MLLLRSCGEVHVGRVGVDKSGLKTCLLVSEAGGSRRRVLGKGRVGVHGK